MVREREQRRRAVIRGRKAEKRGRKAEINEACPKSD